MIVQFIGGVSRCAALIEIIGKNNNKLRDGPLENLWGGGGAGEVQKKNSRKGKINEKKFLISNFLEIDFEINISDKKSRRFDPSEVIFKCIKVL